MLDLFSEIWSTLRHNKLRTALTGFAVSWGIIIIIVLLGTGNGLMNALMNNAMDTVQNIIAVYPGSTSKPSWMARQRMASVPASEGHS